MQEKSDAELLREYVARANEAAFREIVTRHADLVYASALRQARSPELARDIAQTVFADLVRRAPSLGQTLSENASLVGWLYRSTRFETHTRLRDDRRRQARERQAMENFDPTSEISTEWERVGPVLDEAMAELSDEDRDALLLRFFKNHDFRAIGVVLGVSDDAAQKRVSRALERLRAEFTRRGVTTTAVALSTAVSAHAVAVGPAGLAATLATAALTGTALATTVTATTAKAIAMTTFQKTIIAGTIAAAVSTGIYEARQVSALRTYVQSLQQRQAPLVEQIEKSKQEYGAASRKLASQQEESDRLKSDARELLRLRGEVGLLRRQSGELAALQNENQRLRQETSKLEGRGTNQLPFQSGFFSRDQWLDKGTDEPLNTLLSMLHAMKQGDEDRLGQLVSRGDSPQSLDRLLIPKADWNRVTGVQIVNISDPGPMAVGGKLQHQVTIETILEQVSTILENQIVTGRSIRRWFLLDVNGQWLITGRN
jgi:RNA polymerase sigma factor (sigma-70 family)